MRIFYEDKSGEEYCIDTRKIDYEAVWKSISLRWDRWPAADKVVDLFHRDMVKGPNSSLKSAMREANRLAGTHYLTRDEIQNAASDDTLVKRLIDYDILELHGKWYRGLVHRRRTEKGTSIGPGHKPHPQAAYRMNWRRLNDIAESKR